MFSSIHQDLTEGADRSLAAVLANVTSGNGAIEINGKEIDARQRCAALRVDPAKTVLGDFPSRMSGH